jgi:hypothetical protein
MFDARSCVAFPIRSFVVEGEDLTVIACFHASRDPSQWQERT